MALKEKQVEEEYAVSIRNNFQQLNFLQRPELPDTDEIWQRGKDDITEASSEEIGRVPQKTNKPWVTETSLKLMEERRRLKNTSKKAQKTEDDTKK